MNEFLAPDLEYVELLPVLIIFAVACLAVLVEAFVPRVKRHLIQVALSVIGLVSALVATVVVGLDLPEHGDGTARGIVAGLGSLTIDGPTIFLWGTILVIALLGVFLFAERDLDGGVSAFAGQAAALPGTAAERTASRRGLDHTEVYPLMLFGVLGMLLFPASNDLLTLFVALEIMSLPLYLLSGLARRRRLLSQEAAMKYFLLGAFASGIFLYGASLIYGYAGSMGFAEIHEAVSNDTDNPTMLALGTGLLLVGLMFKVGAVPFHAWTPDVYQGAPTPVTAFMAAGTKVAAFGAMLRLLYVALDGEAWAWQPVLWIVAVLSMTVGTLMALTQTDVKRMLAYSSVAHTGFILTGVLGFQAASALGAGEISSLQAVLFYLFTYALTILGAFALVSLVRDGGGETNGLDRWAGLGKESPTVAALFSFLLLAMAGIPLTSGFIGKWAVFAVAMSAGAWPVVVIAVLTSAVAVWLYVRVIVIMWFQPAQGEGPSISIPSFATTGTIAVAVAATLVLGVLPGPVLDLAGNVGQFIR